MSFRFNRALVVSMLTLSSVVLSTGCDSPPSENKPSGTPVGTTGLMTGLTTGGTLELTAEKSVELSLVISESTKGDVRASHDTWECGFNVYQSNGQPGREIEPGVWSTAESKTVDGVEGTYGVVRVMIPAADAKSAIRASCTNSALQDQNRAELNYTIYIAALNPPPQQGAQAAAWSIPVDEIYSYQTAYFEPAFGPAASEDARFAFTQAQAACMRDKVAAEFTEEMEEAPDSSGNVDAAEWLVEFEDQLAEIQDDCIGNRGSQICEPLPVTTALSNIVLLESGSTLSAGAFSVQTGFDDTTVDAAGIPTLINGTLEADVATPFAGATNNETFISTWALSFQASNSVSEDVFDGSHGLNGLGEYETFGFSIMDSADANAGSSEDDVEYTFYYHQMNNGVDNEDEENLIGSDYLIQMRFRLESLDDDSSDGDYTVTNIAHTIGFSSDPDADDNATLDDPLVIDGTTTLTQRFDTVWASGGFEADDVASSALPSGNRHWIAVQENGDCVGFGVPQLGFIRDGVGPADVTRPMILNINSAAQIVFSLNSAFGMQPQDDETGGTRNHLDLAYADYYMFHVDMSGNDAADSANLQTLVLHAKQLTTSGINHSFEAAVLENINDCGAAAAWVFEGGLAESHAVRRYGIDETFTAQAMSSSSILPNASYNPLAFAKSTRYEVTSASGALENASFYNAYLDTNEFGAAIATFPFAVAGQSITVTEDDRDGSVGNGHKQVLTVRNQEECTLPGY